MIEVRVSVRGLDALRANFSKAPALTLKYLAKATSAAIFEVEKQAIDSNFQFKTPRAQRTGQLQQSFATVGTSPLVASWVASDQRSAMRPMSTTAPAGATGLISTWTVLPRPPSQRYRSTSKRQSILS